MLRSGTHVLEQARFLRIVTAACATALVVCSLESLLQASLKAGAANDQTAPPGQWFKGNTHTHTLNSDGDSTPDEVVRWYREHGYQFVVLTDHNFLTSVDGLNALLGADQQFLVIRGEEVTDRFDDKPLHINGLDLAAVVTPQGGSSVVDVLQRNVDAIRSERGIPHINHPSFGWAVTADELAAVRNTRLFEVFNGHPRVNNVGGGGVPGLEDAWDAILSQGHLLYGLAVDDAHTFKQPGNPDVPGPGRGWVVVRAPRLEARAIVEAIDQGDFYASTGVELEAYERTSERITLTVKATSYSKYRVQFIGRGGRILQEVTTPNASYTFQGQEGYVRAKVIESNGRVAWMQPVTVRPPSGAGYTSILTAMAFALGVVFRWSSFDRGASDCRTPRKLNRHVDGRLNLSIRL